MPALRAAVARVVEDVDPGDVVGLGAYTDADARSLVAAGLTLRPSGLSEKRRLSCLMAISGGVLGRVSNLVRAALAHAVARGAEVVEVCDLSAATGSWS